MRDAVIVALIGAATTVGGMAFERCDGQHRVEESRESCGDAVSQLSRFAAECADRCMGE